MKISYSVSKAYPASRYIYEIRQLGQLKKNILKFQAKTAQVINFLNSFKKFAHSIPSIWPVVGTGIITSGYGVRVDPFTMRPMFHPGIDISSFEGTPIRATANGVVSAVGNTSGTGNMVIVKHRYGFHSAYFHLQKYVVSEGERVNRGEIIGYLGHTGRALGDHLHYEVRINGVHVDPLAYARLDSF